jgi:hypothetical protein
MLNRSENFVALADFSLFLASVRKSNDCFDAIPTAAWRIRSGRGVLVQRELEF